MPPLNNPAIGFDPLQTGGIFATQSPAQYEDFGGYQSNGATNFATWWSILGTVDFSLLDATDHPGLIEMTAGAAPGFAVCGQTVNSFALPNAFWQVAINTRVPVLSTGAQAFTARYGVINFSAVQPTDGVYFEYSDASPNWQAVCRNGGVQTKVDTGVVVVANAFVTLSASVAGAGAPVVFSIAGVAVASIGTNLPTGNNLGEEVQILKTNGVNPATIHIDLFYFGYAFASFR